MTMKSFRRGLCAAFLILFSAACTAPSKDSASQAPSDPFAGLDGCFLLYNVKSGRFDQVIGEETCRKRFPACSTFKVPLAVMAFDSGALKDEKQILKWKGEEGVLPSHNRDQDAGSWMRESVVWFSQRLTPRIGAGKVQKYLNDFDYGNRDMSAGLTEAWLVRPSEEGGLRLSAYEQVDFMKKLWGNALPVSKRSMRLTREITFLETSPRGFELSGKTGSNFYDKNRQQAFGWFVGRLAKAGQEYIVVTNISDLEPVEGAGFGGPRAKAITKKILETKGLW